jgi:hypothetical protein
MYIGIYGQRPFTYPSAKKKQDTIMKSKFLSNFLIAAFTKRVFYFISRDFVPGEFVPRGFVSGDFVPG